MSGALSGGDPRGRGRIRLTLSSNLAGQTQMWDLAMVQAREKSGESKNTEKAG